MRLRESGINIKNFVRKLNALFYVDIIISESNCFRS